MCFRNKAQLSFIQNANNLNNKFILCEIQNECVNMPEYTLHLNFTPDSERLM